MTRRQRIDDLPNLAVPERPALPPEQPALSPDGAHAAYVLRTGDVDRTTRLWRIAVRGVRPRRPTRGPSDTAPAWSPDGRRRAHVLLRATPEVG